MRIPSEPPLRIAPWSAANTTPFRKTPITVSSVVEMLTPLDSAVQVRLSLVDTAIQSVLLPNLPLLVADITTKRLLPMQRLEVVVSIEGMSRALSVADWETPPMVNTTLSGADITILSPAPLAQSVAENTTPSFPTVLPRQLLVEGITSSATIHLSVSSAAAITM